MRLHNAINMAVRRKYMLVSIGLMYFIGAGFFCNVSAHDTRSYRGSPFKELYVNGGSLSGNMAARNSLLGGVSNFPGAYSTIYVAEVFPGSEYTLGLSYQAKNQRVAVTLFDRWPYESGSKIVRLPAAPVVKTHYTEIKFRWQIGISGESTGTLLYILVETEPTGRSLHPMSHNIFLVTPSIKPSATVGEGATFLQGPEAFVLVGEQMPVSYVVEKPQVDREDSRLSPGIALPGDLIRNGSFHEGLNYWLPHRNYEKTEDITFSLIEKEGLKLWSSSDSNRSGLMQIVNANVADASALILRADVKVTKQTLGGTGPNKKEAPIAVAICYEDTEGGKHCGDNNYWKGFYALEATEPNRAENGQMVAEGLWHRVILDLMQLKPRPGTIRYISIEGSGWPEREGWARDVHLVKRRNTL